MEKFPLENRNDPNSAEAIKQTFDRYMKYFPLTEEELKKPLLDVGAGNGLFVQYLRTVLHNKDAYSIEVQKEKVDPSKEGMLVGDGMQIPFPDGTFEIVTAKDYLPMFVRSETTAKQSINELIRVAKSGGKILGNIATPESVKETEEDIKNNIQAGTREYEADIEDCRIKYEGAKKLQEYLKELEQEGFQIAFVNNRGNKSVIEIHKP
jgi:ubiquinone/menaquinone biosynthesis C-methylase UbiE